MVTCAWCRETLSIEDPDIDSHGICEPCEQEHFPEEEEDDDTDDSVRSRVQVP